MHAKEARQSERERERKKERREERRQRKAQRARFTFSNAHRRAARDKRKRKREERTGTLLAFSLTKIAGPFAGREKKKKETRKKKKNFARALTSTSTRPPLCELDGLTR